MQAQLDEKQAEVEALERQRAEDRAAREAKQAAWEKQHAKEMADLRAKAEAEKAEALQEQEAAKAVFDNVAHTGNLDEPFIRHLISPLAVFNGDVLLAERNPAGDRAVLVREVLGDDIAAGVLQARWDDGDKALRIRMHGPVGE